ncbi:1607_t:CDS:2, partial [Funneliformis geosporum]
SWRANENINRLRKKRMNDNNIDTGTNCLQFSSCSDVRIESVESVLAPKRRKNLSLSKKNKEIVDLTEDTSDRKRKTQSKESVKKRARAETTVDGKVDDGPKTPPRKPLEEKETKDITTPQKPKLCERSSQYLSKHISVNINEQGLIMKGDQDVIIPEIPDEIQRWLINVLSSEKDRFVSTIMASLNPEHKFQKMCRIILYDFFSMTSEGLMDRNIGERKYTVEQIMPLFKAIQSVYREYKFDWIEVQLECIKDMKLLFPNFDLTLNKADGVCMKASNNKEVVFIEVSGGPEATVEKHVWEDTEKLIREAMFGLVSLLRDYLDKNSTGAKNIRTYMVQVIGDRMTLSEIRLVGKHFYTVSQIKSAVIPFAFDDVEKFFEIFELLYILLVGFNFILTFNCENIKSPPSQSPNGTSQQNPYLSSSRSI